MKLYKLMVMGLVIGSLIGFLISHLIADHEPEFKAPTTSVAVKYPTPVIVVDNLAIGFHIVKQFKVDYEYIVKLKMADIDYEAIIPWSFGPPPTKLVLLYDTQYIKNQQFLKENGYR